MLYKLGSTDGKFVRLDAVPFKDFSSFGNLEKDLEHLIARSILEVLFEEAGLMPICQERQYQAEADIYALNSRGELTIFELKRQSAGQDAVNQALRYAQEAGQWSYAKLEEKYQTYSGSKQELHLAHQEAFELEHALDARQINQRQHIVVIGSAADDPLIRAVDYWQKQGVSINFLPYRVFEIGQDKYFEFFALPYDRHRNPLNSKSVIFDTNRSYDEESIWYMMENSRVAAFGDAKRFVEYLEPGDIVFYSHKWVGIVAAARVRKGKIVAPDTDTLYRDVEFITPIPSRHLPIRGMPFGMVSELTGKSFFWARTIKVPYMTKAEGEELAEKLKRYLESMSSAANSSVAAPQAT